MLQIQLIQNIHSMSFEKVKESLVDFNIKSQKPLKLYPLHLAGYP